MPLMRPATTLFVTLALAGAAAPAAHGAIVSVPTPAQHKGFVDAPQASYFGTAGEANRLRVTSTTLPKTTEYSPAERWTFTDAGATITAGPGCAAVDPHTATCDVNGTFPKVDLGDGDDELVTDRSVDATLGAGNDTARTEQRPDGVQITVYLAGGDGDDRLNGGAAGYAGLNGDGGADTLTGSMGGESLNGGSGNDTIDGGPGADTIDGAGGADDITCGADPDRATVDARDTLRPTPVLAPTPPPAPASTPTPPDAATTPAPILPAGLETDCEALLITTLNRGVESTSTATPTFEMMPAPPSLDAGGRITIGERSGVKVRGELELRSERGALLATGSMKQRSTTVTLKLTKLGRRTLTPGTTTPVRFRTSPQGGKRSKTRGPGTAVTLRLP